MKILVVDDKQEMRDSIGRILSAEGYEVDMAANGLAGFEKAQNNEYSLYIIDHLMPIMNGTQLAKNLKNVAHCHLTPILFMTTQGVESASTLAECNFFSAIIAKPIQTEQFVLQVSQLLDNDLQVQSG